MQGQVVVDWDLEKLMKEYDNGERLTAEEEWKLELDLAEYMHEFKLKELDAEIEKLNVKVEEMTRKAEEDDVERKQRNEEINMLRRKLEGSGEDVERVVMRREEASLSGSRVRRRSRVRCWDLTRPGGCWYGARCRYLHPEEEVVSAEDGYSVVEGECRPLGYNEQMRKRQEEQDFHEARARGRRMRENQQQQQQLMMRNQQMKSQQQPRMVWQQQYMMMSQQQHMMEEQQQHMMNMMVVPRYNQAWSALQ